MEFDDIRCPRCKSSKYQNPALKLMINVCGHSLCKQCVETLFVKGSGNCVECKVPLRRNDFRLQIFDDNAVEKEVEIRKKLIKDYYRTEDDFNTLKEYNDYLEEFENMVYNLAHNSNVKETTDKIEQFRRENKDAVIKNRQKYAKILEKLEVQMEEEEQAKKYKKHELEEEEKCLKKKKLMEKEALIDELSYSEQSAENIVGFFAEAQNKGKDETERKKLTKTNHFSSGQIINSDTSVYGAIPKFEIGPLYVYTPPPVVLEGPPYPTTEEIVSRGYLKFLKEQTVAEIAGGFNMVYACARILQEAMVGLYYNAGRPSSSQ